MNIYIYISSVAFPYFVNGPLENIMEEISNSINDIKNI